MATGAPGSARQPWAVRLVRLAVARDWAHGRPGQDAKYLDTMFCMKFARLLIPLIRG